MTPKISIIVPIYNVDKYLSKCLNSLIHQTIKEIEIICVDDGSKDNSAKIVKEYQQKDSRIRYLYQENAGLSSARNTGLTETKAPYVMFCDSDDWYDKSMCHKMYDAITQNDVDMACCGTNIIYEADKNLKKSDEAYYRVKFSGSIPASKEILEKTDVSSWNKIFKKSLIEKYNITFPVGLIYEDSCFFFKYLAVAKNIYFLQDKLYNYVRRQGSIMNATLKGSEKAVDHIKVMSNVFDFLKENNLWSKWETTFYTQFLQYFNFGYTHLPKDKKDKAFDAAIPIMEKLNPDLGLLSDANRKLWQSILNRSFCLYKKEIKFFGLRIVKIKRQTDKCSIFFLGIQIYSRKTKKDKEIFSILYVPFFKMRIKHV